MIARAVVRFLVLVLTFAIDIRVRAENAQLPHAMSLQQEPDGCWKNHNQHPCAARTMLGEKAKLEFAGGHLLLDESTMVVRTAEGHLRLLAGTVWIKSGRPTVVQCEFGTMESQGGEFWIVRSDERMTAFAIENSIFIKPRGVDGEAIQVPQFMENWFGRVGIATARAQTGIPIAIAFKPHLKRWARLYAGSSAKFESEAEEFHLKWSEATADAADIHKKLYDRKISTIDRDEAKRAKERRKVEARNRELIELFKRKVFDP